MYIGLLGSSGDDARDLFAQSALIITVGLAGIFIFQVYLLSIHGQTIAKKVAGIRIVSARSYKTGGFFQNFFVRSVLNVILGLIPFYWIVDSLFIFSESRQCVHDHLAGTIVVKAKDDQLAAGQKLNLLIPSLLTAGTTVVIVACFVIAYR